MFESVQKQPSHFDISADRNDVPAILGSKSLYQFSRHFFPNSRIADHIFFIFFVQTTLREKAKEKAKAKEKEKARV